MGRTPCCNVEGLKKGAWTSEEDRKLTAYIQEHGEGGWRTLPQRAGLQRCGKSCRLRWANYLRPDIKRGEFSPEEEERIIELHASLGNRWSAIARHLPRRTDNEIKNYWNTHLKKRLSERGIDPTTHKPIGPTTSSSDDAVPSLSSSNNNNAPTAERQQQQQLVPGPAADDRHASSSASAQLLNKLAAKLAPHSSSRRFNTEQDEDVEDGEAPNDAAPNRSSSSSAKLLNKMASRLAHPLHCLNTLKSILSSASSSAAVAAAASGTDSAGNYSNFMHRCASTSSLSESTAATTSISTSNNDHPAQTASSKHDQLAFLESLDLDVLNDWQQHDPQVDSSDPAIMEFLADTITSKEKEKPYHYNYDEDSLFPASQYGDDGRTLYGSHTLDPGTYADDHYQYMDFDGPSTSASRNYNDPVDDSGYAAEDHAFTATGDTYGHHQFEYQHGAGRLLDGDDEYGRTLFDNYGDFRIDAPAFF